MGIKTIHVVDDEEAVRRATSFLLKTMGYAVRDWSSGATFLDAANEVEPGIVLLDLRMPDMDGLEVMRSLSDRGLALPVVILTGHGDIRIAVSAMSAGAVDFIEKPVEQGRLAEALDHAFGRLDEIADTSNRTDAAHRALAALTPRERQVLEALAKGLPNKTIAYDLGISIRTVEVHRANLMKKLDVRTFPDALRIAFAAGLG